jgi:hypothetical protein
MRTLFATCAMGLLMIVGAAAQSAPLIFKLRPNSQIRIDARLLESHERERIAIVYDAQLSLDDVLLECSTLTARLKSDATQAIRQIECVPKGN